jgi:hypothetical protein
MNVEVGSKLSLTTTLTADGHRYEAGEVGTVSAVGVDGDPTVVALFRSKPPLALEFPEDWRPKTTTRRTEHKLMLSYRAAARLLGVGRGATLHELIAAGLLRPVKLLRRSFIPRAQVEALAQTGEGPAVQAAAPKRSARGAGRRRSIADIEI